MKTRREIIKNVAVTVLVIITVTLVAAYSCYHSVSVFDTTLMTGVIKAGSSKEYIDMPCAVFYDCTYLEAEQADSLRYSVENGSKVAKDSEIARLYSDDNATDADIQRIAELDSQIAFFSDCLDTAHLTQYAAGEQLRDAYFRYLTSPSTVLQGKDSLTAALNMYNVKVNGRSELLSLINSIKEERDALLESLGNDYSSVTTAESGYFFTRAAVDGYEGVFTASAVTGMTPFKFNELKKAEPSAIPDMTFGKLMTTHKWYIAATLSTSDSQRAGFEKDMTVSLDLKKSGERISCRIVNVSASQNGETAVVFECSALNAAVLSNRFDTVTVCVAEHSGLAVPVSAVQSVDGVSGVFVLERGVLVFKRADVIAYSNGYYIISNGRNADAETAIPDGSIPYPEINDVVIVSGEGLYEGKVIE